MSFTVSRATTGFFTVRIGTLTISLDGIFLTETGDFLTAETGDFLLY